MIRYDKIEPKFFGVGRLFQTHDSAIDGRHDLRSVFLLETFERGAVEPVSLFKTIGHVKDAFSAAFFDSL